jgi:hypothetical protein
MSSDLIVFAVWIHLGMRITKKWICVYERVRGTVLLVAS